MTLRPIPTLATLLLVPMALSGCTTRRQPFPEAPPEVVWTAMKAAAESPTYDDWVVLQNSVLVVDGEQRIEVYRRLIRDVMAPGQPRRREDADWKLRLLLERSKEGVPEVVFVSRDWAIPAHAWGEADRYFADVRMLMGGIDAPSSDTAGTPVDGGATPRPTASPAPRTPPTPAPAPAPAPASASPGTAPPVDLPE